MTSFELKVSKIVQHELATQNRAFVHPTVYSDLPQGSLAPEDTKYISIRGNIYMVEAHQSVQSDQIQMNLMQRNDIQVAFSDLVEIRGYIPKRPEFLDSMTIEASSDVSRITDPEEVSYFMMFVQWCYTRTMFNMEQNFGMKFKERVFRGRVTELFQLDAENKPSRVHFGIFTKNTKFNLVSGPEKTPVMFDATSAVPVFRPDWNFDSMGIGGLDSEFADIFRRAFASRVFPPHQLKELGIKHVKGLLLHGPPGTGKTLIARQIGKMLNGREPKVVNGPEVLSKFVGQSEENVRALFADAEHEQKKRGENSSLHIIILDELDAICAQRGSRSGSTGVGDTVVNQLLSKIDGVDALNNILLIGMTNRLDMIDDALLRPGRFEVHMEIGLPDEAGRLQILKIHTSKMAAAKKIPDVNLPSLAAKTRNFTGAEIEGLVKSAASFAMQRHVSADDPSKPKDADKIIVRQADFDAALKECTPAHGVASEVLAERIPNGFIIYDELFEVIYRHANELVASAATGKFTPLVSMLIHGDAGSGKTAFAAKLALESQFPYAKVIEAAGTLGMPESSRVLRLRANFEAAYKSPVSVLILDDIERLIDYVPVGPRFSNPLLQALMVLCKTPPPRGHRLLILATTSRPNMVEDLDFGDVFTERIFIPNVPVDSACFLMDELGASVELLPKAIPIKNLLAKISAANE